MNPKRVWNKFVRGFETGVWNIALFVTGLAENQDLLSLQSYLPERIGTVFMYIGAAGIVIRYFISIGFIKPFGDEDVVS